MKKVTLSIVLIIILALGLLSCVIQPDIDSPTAIYKETLEETKKSTEDTDNKIPSDLKDLLPPSNIAYLGAFRLPDDGDLEENMFSYGGEAICYNSANNSLFIIGHNWFINIAQISIPEPVISKDISQLEKAELLQDFTDIKGNLFDKWTMEIPRVGIEVVGEYLFFCFGEHYEEDTSLGTHGYTDLNLSKARKVCTVGDNLYSTNDYMFAIPQEYISSFKGNDLFTGRFRDGGWSGMGPSLFAIKSEDIINATNNERIDTVAIIKYDDSYNEDDGHKMDDYSHADSWAGGAFVSCAAGEAIVFVGTHGYGDTWYGFSNGVVYPTSGDENEQVPEVPDYPHDERGWWNDDFRACIAFYSIEDAAKVINGKIKSYEIQPYAFLDLSEYMTYERDETVMQYLGGCAYDIQNNRLFILELFADGDKPIVHVFTFE